VLRARYDWKDAAEQTKFRLNTETSTEFRVEAGAIGRIEDRTYWQADNAFTSRITAEDMQQLIAGLLLECQNLVVGALELAKVATSDIDYVVHTGRTSLMPLIQRNIADLFPGLSSDRFKLDHEDLKVCVAKGAALYGTYRDAPADAPIRLADTGRRLPHAYGVAKNAKLQAGQVFDEIIPIGEECPVFRDLHYKSKSSFRRLSFYQNAGRNLRINGNPDVKYLGQFAVDIGNDDDQGCNVRFMIDANRILSVSVDGQPVKINPQPMDDDERWIG
jgi:molecular chaperone DnaK (HSP70)